MSDKSLRYCVEYARLSAEIKRLTRDIGEALDGCPGEHGKRQSSQTEDGRTIFGGDDDETHLKAAYKPEEVESDYSGVDLEYLSDAAIREHLSGVCPACLAAHEAIQQRKAARKSFGAVKRSIMATGRSAMKREEVSA
ncbi:hypothetical protein [Paraburkholderia saeva]|uniref:hypothetical protein n=1 Tax=Paraburkholderia saeva TaxID=2777537 RepID=UPI001DE75D09|nr:hypothetical protein [Paraburkholderia saeva]CAG4887764.1 hypothetical protein R52603_00507 [Paraburkholderia saeva]